MMNKFFRTVVSSLLLGTVILACGVESYAVTDAEMDEAEAIAAKYYIRYVNDGSGYLDNWTPKSMSDLENKLTKTDKENLAQFKKAAVATDYKSWDKAQLVSYWSNTFFSNNASVLNSKGAANGACKTQIRKAIEKLDISSPAEESVETASVDPSPEGQATPDEIAIENELAQVEAELAQAGEVPAVEESGMEEPQKQSSGTWVYIMVLAILVAVVIFLVVYASKTMKGEPKPAASKNAGEPRRKEEPRREPTVTEPQPDNDDKPNATLYHADDTRMREKYAATLAAKSEEIRNLTRQLAEMESLAASLKEENRTLTAELEQLRKYATASRPRYNDSDNERFAPRHSQNHHREHSEPARTSPREVYLGRVNSKGLFIRADRHAIDGQSIYKLTTTDGITGTFSLINNPLIVEQVLEDPGKWISGGCVAKDIFDTEGKEEIRTEIPGTAVFRDGAWRVDRKAKISYL